MQDIFSYRDEVINEYKSFSRSFTNISAPDIKSVVDKEYDEGRYWPDPLIQINPNYKTEKNINELCDDGTLENECRQIFQVDKKEDGSGGKTMTLYTHQQEAIALAAMKQSYVVTTGTGSGKSLAFFIPIVNEILKNRANNKGRTSAIIIYPMNALANSQLEEIKKFLRGYDEIDEIIQDSFEHVKNHNENEIKFADYIARRFVYYVPMIKTEVYKSKKECIIDFD